jgi:hypothetical protein
VQCCDNVALRRLEGRHGHGSRPELCLDFDTSTEAWYPREIQPAWRPRGFHDEMLRAYECYAPDGNEVVGISIWDSPELRERFRLSEVETERRQAMAPFVLKESSGFYVGRELKIPER